MQAKAQNQINEFCEGTTQFIQSAKIGKKQQTRTMRSGKCVFFANVKAIQASQKALPRSHLGVQSGAEIAGNGCFKRHRLASDRMMKRQAESVQAHAAARVILMPILAVAHHRMSNVCHVDTNLVFAACEQVKE